jgi:hypothetical protein
MSRVMMRHQPLLWEIADHPWIFVVALVLVFGLMALASERVQGWWWQYRVLRGLRRKTGPRWPLP